MNLTKECDVVIALSDNKMVVEGKDLTRDKNLDDVCLAVATFDTTKSNWEPVNLCFVSEDYIHAGDYWVMPFTGEVEKCLKESLSDDAVFNPNNIGGRKVIATTDASLSLPKIPTKFIKEYIDSKGFYNCVSLAKTEPTEVWSMGWTYTPSKIAVTKNNEVIINER